MSINALQPSSAEIIVQATCNEIPVNLFIDTGASISLVNTRFIDQADLFSSISGTQTRISGLDKKLVPVRGEVTLDIRLGNSITKHMFIVCDKLDNEFLIGVDFLEKVNANIDFRSKKFLLPNSEHDFIAKPSKIEKIMKIRCKKNIKIPANTSCYIMGKMPVKFTKSGQNYEGVVEPYRNMTNKIGVYITGTRSYSRGNEVPVHCVNVTPKNVTVYRNQLIAFLEPIEDEKSARGVHKVEATEDRYDSHLDIPRLDDAESVENTVENGKWDDVTKLYEQLKIDKMDIPEEYKEKLKKLVSEYSHCFSRDRFDLGKASFYRANINLKRDWVAKWVPSRPIPYKLESHMDEEIERMLSADIITRCPLSLWNTPVMIIKKPKLGEDGEIKYRFIQDARGLNSQCLQDNYELPRINNILDRMSNCKWLSTMDFQSGFTQISLDEDSQPLTAFTYRGNRYMQKRLQMGQTSSSAQFSRALSHLFSRVPFESLVLYIDDILLWSDTLESHLKKLRFIFERLTWGNLKLNGAKSRLLRKECTFLGRKISKNGIKLDDEKVEAIRKLPPPTNVKQLQKILGMLNYNRQFIKGYATIAAPLYELLRKNKKFEWSRECQDSLETLKSALCTSTTLSLPDLSDKHQSFQVCVDSSKRGQGATLSQEIDGERKLIAYWSRAVPKHQQNMGATKLELIALHAALKHWELLLKGTKFTVLTDCRALLSLSTMLKNESSFFQRRLAELATFNFEVKHVSGDSDAIKMADFLSRYSYERKSQESGTQTDMIAEADDWSNIEPKAKSRIEKILLLSEAEKTAPVTKNDVRSQYKEDATLVEVMTWVERGEKPTRFDHRSQPRELSHYWTNFNRLKIEDGILYHEWTDPKTNMAISQIVIPFTLVERILYTTTIR